MARNRPIGIRRLPVLATFAVWRHDDLLGHGQITSVGFTFPIRALDGDEGLWTAIEAAVHGMQQDGLAEVRLPEGLVIRRA